jgi:hypothetical protein
MRVQRAAAEDARRARRGVEEAARAEATRREAEATERRMRRLLWRPQALVAGE